ncbi:DNA packaging protein Nu1 [Tamilnaduibacter salinus]|uniref:DNA packaging protein Nu1 n=1 Tax=Tamilnaduibacter salinus TaxID=1484056 RepID=A0A2A2I1A8_9GAMM|nr:terminase small subunit [Tamilnaduibacter salinus]PAV25198.1 DNA-packaging protein [Tamilnaduibacter salinus]PVY78184.1 DNA packaging protein Nu1 [Tamilnaduibacter salinus]
MIEKPEKHWLNQQQMARSLGITVSAFARWEVTPVARIGKQVFYDVQSVLDNRLSNMSETVGTGNIEDERLRLTRAQAEGQEIKNELARGRTVPIEIITQVLSRVAGGASGILDSLPLNIKRRFPELDNQMVEAIKRECVKSQNEIARIDEVLEDSLRGYLEDQDG